MISAHAGTCRNTLVQSTSKLCRLVKTLALAVLGSTATAALAAAPTFVPPIVTTASTILFSNGSTSLGPGQVGVDRAGNVFYISHVAPYTLYEIPASTPAVTITAPVVLITGLGQYNSTGVFVDPKGNLWVANGSGSATVGGATEYIGLLEIPANGTGIPNTAAIPAGGETVAQMAAANCTGTSTVPCVWQDNTFATNLTGYYVQPSALFVDAASNVYFVDVYDNTSAGKYNRIVRFNALTAPGTGTLLADNLTANNAATLAVDGAGKLYYADSPTSGGNGKVSLVSGGVLTTVGNTSAITGAQIASATGVAADIFGNLYISSTTQVSQVPFEGTALNFADEFVITTGLTNTITYGGSPDQYGNYYYASYTNIQQLQVGGYNFGRLAVGSQATGTSTPAAPSLTLYFNTAEAGVSSYFPTGSPTSNTAPALLQSFPYSGTKSFAGGTSFTAGQTGTLTMNFQPIHAGALKGAYTPRSNGVNDAVVNLQGVGVGPQSFFLPGIATSLFSSANASSTSTTPVPLNGPTGLAVDTYGDIFVADTNNGKIVADCLATTTAAVSGTGTGGTTNSFCGNSGYLGNVVELSTGATKPAAIALDGANNLYVLDGAANTVTSIQGVNLTSATLVAATDTFGGTPLAQPKGLAVDGYSNLYIADTGNNRIVEAHQFGATATNDIVLVPATTTFGGIALSSPVGIAIDSANNLFIADRGNNRIVEYSANGVASIVAVTGVTLNAPTGVVVLPSGSLVVTDTGNNVSLITAGKGTALPIGAFTVTAPQGIALDLAGNIYLSDTALGRVLELNTSSPTLSTSPSTQQPATSAPKTTSVINSGNAALVLSAAPALDAGDTSFAISGSSTCANGTSVAAGGNCTIVTTFTPKTTGTINGSVTLTDNQLAYTLNTTTSNETATFGTNGSQVINLTGVGAANANLTPQTINFTQPTSPVTYGAAPITLTATGGGSGNPIVFSVISGPGTVSGNTLTIIGAGTIVVAADQAGNATYAPASEVTRSVVVNQATQTVTFTPLATPIAYTTTPITLSGTGGASGNPVTFSVVSGPATVSGNQLTLTGVGTVVFAANQAGNTNYSAAPQVTQSVVVNPAPQAITFTAPQSPIVYSSNPIVLTATGGASGNPVVFSIVSGPGTVSGSTVNVTGIGSIVIAANQAASTNYSAAPQVTQTVVVNAIGTVATLVFSLAGGTYFQTQALFLSDSTPGAAIYYTVDGSTPTTASTLYTSTTAMQGIQITASETVNAIAILAGYISSPVGSTVYTISNTNPNFTVALSPTSLTVTHGQTGTITLTLTPTNGFNQVVSFGCTGLPLGAGCAFSPATVTTLPTQAPVTTVLTITAPATVSQLEQGPGHLLPGLSLASLLVLFGLRKRRTLRLVALLCFASLGLTMISGCGSTTATNNTTPITVSIGGGSIRQSVVVNLTVQ